MLFEPCYRLQDLIIDQLVRSSVIIKTVNFHIFSVNFYNRHASRDDSSSEISAVGLMESEAVNVTVLFDEEADNIQNHSTELNRKQFSDGFLFFRIKIVA